MLPEMFWVSFIFKENFFYKKKWKSRKMKGCRRSNQIIKLVKDTHREKPPPSKIPALTTIMNIDIWVIGTSKQLFIRVLKVKQIFKKIN